MIDEESRLLRLRARSSRARRCAASWAWRAAAAARGDAGGRAAGGAHPGLPARPPASRSAHRHADARDARSPAAPIATAAVGRLRRTLSANPNQSSRTRRNPLMSSVAQDCATHRHATARVGVVGLGYVGLPLAVEFARSGLARTGIDLDPRKVDADQRAASRTSPTCRPPTSRTCVGSRHAARDDRLPRRRPNSTRSTSACRRRCARRRTPTCRYIVSAVEAIAAHLHPGMLVVLESTTYPGTTEEARPAAARAQRPQGRRRLLPGVLARARRPGQRRVPHAQRAQGRRRHDAGVHASWRRRSTDGDRARSCRSARRASPRW